METNAQLEQIRSLHHVIMIGVWVLFQLFNVHPVKYNVGGYVMTRHQLERFGLQIIHMAMNAHLKQMVLLQHVTMIEVLAQYLHLSVHRAKNKEVPYVMIHCQLERFGLLIILMVMNAQLTQMGL
jgi:hypothetical protein